MTLNVYTAVSTASKSFVPKKPNTFNIPPTQRMEEAMRRNLAKKFEAEMKRIIDKPSSERTLEENIKLVAYKTAQGLMDMKNYPPVMY